MDFGCLGFDGLWVGLRSSGPGFRSLHAVFAAEGKKSCYSDVQDPCSTCGNAETAWNVQSNLYWETSKKGTPRQGLGSSRLQDGR